MLGKTTYPPLPRQLKSGAWVFGAGSAPVPDDWTWSIDLPSIYRGWVCQPHMPGDHAPLAEVMATVVEHRPARPEPIVGGDWREQWELMPRCLASEHNIKGSYKTASMNGLGAIGLLFMQLKQHLRVDRNNRVAIVRFSARERRHQRFVPLIEVVGWMPGDGPRKPEPPVVKEQLSSAGARRLNRGWLR